ncbi:efflux RND transporter periplasmic adaptor subunit [Enterococcus sp. 669A]|uniref:Efflux RND transporter periplasmic adaptor subunit n=1 Tax=Candidatus Enterococcus moelleringii TaxID=2815325 RepID=A0ABS3LBA9_9ENTE|nr:efflux RND transporter periplasmic adaptor subunit [Enterococcus sp. 669A]MBO1306906.1 efflux RND transporter periplasmic adaptor subunit [Enterococcus sp. 669A]
MKKVLIGISALIIAGTGFFLYQNTQAKAKADTQSIELYEVKKQTPLHLKGQVQPVRTQTVLVNPEKGSVQTIHVKNGDHVLKDAELITYSGGEKIRATDNAIVTSLDEDAKNNPQKPLMVLKSEETIINGTVTEYDRSQVRLEETVDIQCVNDEKTVKGRVKTISEVNSDLSETQQSGIVSYDFTAVPDEPILAGYSVEVLIPRNEVHLPLKSVVEHGGNHYVYSVSSGKAQEESVTVEKRKGYYILRDGVSTDDKIIKDASDIKDGMEVTVE